MAESLFYMIWRGIAIGVLISAPMGPVGMLCIQRTLDKGRRAGLFTGIGAATSDIIYCLLTGFGLSFIEEFLERNQNVIQLFGSAVLIAFGIYIFRKNPAITLKKKEREDGSYWKNFLTGFLFTFSNPLILFLIVGLFARFNFLLPEIQFYHYILGFLFIFGGALAWWWIVTFSVDKVRTHFNVRSMWLINRTIACIIFLFALVGIVTGIMALSSPASASVRYWNSARGLLPVNDPDGIDVKPGFEFYMRASSPARSSWNIELTDTAGQSLLYSVTPVEKTDGFGMTSDALKLEVSLNGDKVASYVVPEEAIGTLGRPFSLRLSNPGETFRLESAHGADLKCPEVETPGFRPARLRISGRDLKIVRASMSEPEDPAQYAELRNPSGADPMEGRWRLLDRSLDENLLRLGGSYECVLLRNPEGGYRLMYLAGSRVNATDWRPGRVKAVLEPSGFEGVYRCTWFDASGLPMSNEVTAQRNADGTELTISFPYQDSWLRLRKTAD